MALATHILELTTWERRHYVDRWIFSQTLATVALLVLMLTVGISRHAWLDLLHMWFVTIAINNLRLTLTRGR